MNLARIYLVNILHFMFEIVSLIKNILRLMTHYYISEVAGEG